MGLCPLTQSIQEAAGQAELDGGRAVLVGLGATFGHGFLSPGGQPRLGFVRSMFLLYTH